MAKFNIEDCTMIEMHEYRCLCFNFPQWKDERFGMIVNEKGHKFYFIKDEFKRELNLEGFL